MSVCAPTIWAVDFGKDCFRVYFSGTDALIAFQILEYEEEGNHRPFNGFEDNYYVDYDCFISNILEPGSRAYNVTQGLYHDSVINDVDSSIPTIPWEFKDWSFAFDNTTTHYDFDTISTKYLEIDDPGGVLKEKALAGDFFFSKVTLGAAYDKYAKGAPLNPNSGQFRTYPNRTDYYLLSLGRVVWANDRWEMIGLKQSETTEFKGGTYVEPPRIVYIEPMDAAKEFVAENAWGVGAIVVVLLFLAILGVLKRRKRVMS